MMVTACSQKAGEHLLGSDCLRLHRAGNPVESRVRCKAWDYNQSRWDGSSHARFAVRLSTAPVQGLDAFIGQLVGALVLGMPGMPSHPVPVNTVSAGEPIQLQPQIDVLD